MKTIQLNQLELTEFVGKENAKQHCKATFPILEAYGSEQLATVYMEIAPGDYLGRHTDSAEELLVVLNGDVQIVIGDERVSASAGDIALVPRMMVHDINNTGKDTAKILGVFGANNIVATFEQEWLPLQSAKVDTRDMV